MCVGVVCVCVYIYIYIKCYLSIFLIKLFFPKLFLVQESHEKPILTF